MNLKSLNAASPTCSKTSEPAAAVTVKVRSTLGLESWRQVRDAREIARENEVPLNIDLTSCPTATMGGLGALMIVKEQLGQLNVVGCSDHMASCFDQLGMCKLCANSDGCEERRQHLKSLRLSSASKPR